MKRIIQTLLIVVITSGVILAQPRAKIVPAPVTAYYVKYAPFVQDSSIYSGLNVPNHTYAYAYVWNWGDNTPITSATWSFVSKPTGSNAQITGFQYNGQYWAKFLADTTGIFNIKVTMVAGTYSKDTTATIVSANYVGTGGFGGIAPQFPNCMSCHQNMQPFQGIFDRWKVSGHANWFRFNIDSGSSSYGTSCMKCHTTGYNHNLVVNNHGFDDVASQVGWSWSVWSPPKPGNWDSLRTKYPSLVAYSSIGCENCHGPGSEHASTGDTNRIKISFNAGMCGQCHDSPNNHIKNYEWNQSKHAASVSIYTSSWAQTISSPDFGTNNLNNCIRCHDPRGYVNFTKGVGTNTTNWTKAEMNALSCATCHDPHGNSNEYYLRNRPANSDTLANGYHYAGGNGKVCMDCHKSRRSNVSYCLTRVTSAFWGPHDATQADILNGQNASTFGGQPYLVGSHKNITDACVTCHMAPTADTGTVYHNRVGEHTFKMVDSSGTYDNVKGCLGCHPGVTKFSDFMAPYDIDGNGLVQDWQTEIRGALHNLRMLLPPVGVDSVSWQLIAADSNNIPLRQAYWNYLVLRVEGSEGIHNPFYILDVYNRTRGVLLGLIGIKPIGNEIPNKFELAQNYPNPFNPTTIIKFSIAKISNVTIKIYDLTGRLVNTIVNQKLNPGKYSAEWNSLNTAGQNVASGVYFYRIETSDFTDTKKMILVK